ncbi:MAG: hypothetical protein VX726_01910 [Planctomycetota bacterium]|nr:hypothetical protein [Planctomycetota bacterium]
MSSQSSHLSLRTIFGTWWPVAASWILMGVEMPLIAAVLGRLPDSEVQLAAYGGLIFPVSLLIESPVIMLLAASTRLSDSPANYRFLRRFSRVLGYGLTLVHGLIAFTPLFDLVVVPLIDPPAEVVESSRLGFQLMLPFTAAVAERRFHQGLLIRFGRQRQVGIGTIVRLLATTIPLGIALLTGSSRGAEFAALAVSAGVIAEAIYARIGAWSVERGPLRTAVAEQPLDLRRVVRFYTPLALTSTLSLASYAIASAGMNQMPLALVSLALWPAVSGLSFFTRSSGVAFNEVAVRHAGDPGGEAALMRFSLLAGGLFSLLVAIIAITPLGFAWYVLLEGAKAEAMSLATAATIAMVPMPLLSFLTSHWQGMLVHVHRTRPISEGVGIGLAGIVLTLVLFAQLQVLGGIVAATLAMSVGSAVQTAWLWWSWSRVSRRLDPARA